RRQMLYPVLDPEGAMIGIVTRGMLESAAYRGENDQPLGQLSLDPYVTYPEETLRAAATDMAAHDVNKMPVVDREDPRRVLGIVTLTMLLEGRLKDLHEARRSERIL